MEDLPATFIGALTDRAQPIFKAGLLAGSRLIGKPVRKAELFAALDEMLHRRSRRIAMRVRMAGEAVQITLGQIRVGFEQVFGDGAVEHAVAEKFQSLVVIRAVAAVRQCPLQQLWLHEAIADLSAQCSVLHRRIMNWRV